MGVRASRILTHSVIFTHSVFWPVSLRSVALPLTLFHRFIYISHSLLLVVKSTLKQLWTKWYCNKNCKVIAWRYNTEDWSNVYRVVNRGSYGRSSKPAPSGRSVLAYKQTYNSRDITLINVLFTCWIVLPLFVLYLELCLKLVYWFLLRETWTKAMSIGKFYVESYFLLQNTLSLFESLKTLRVLTKFTSNDILQVLCCKKCIFLNKHMKIIEKITFTRRFFNLNRMQQSLEMFSNDIYFFNVSLQSN